ncbi:hypothetical protein [Arhodomonas sp. AD133]|uniref:hypothetical protein n=1 Tax=Arhodomonas sp. AD133 TaxID=3415009 RepID=UPI003EB6AECC
MYYPDEGGWHTDNDRTESFTLRRDGVEIHGGFAGGESALAERDISGNAPVVLSGDIDHDNGGADVTNADGVTETAAGVQGNNSYNVLHFYGSGSANITAATGLDGVTVTAGNADGPAPYHAGGGLKCSGAHSGDNVCSPTVTNATFAGNSAGDIGGAIYNAGQRGGTSSPTITNAAFAGNRAGISGGAIYNNGNGGTSSNGNGGTSSNGNGGTSSPMIINAVFFDNRADDGGAIYNSGRAGGTSSPTITNATFLENRADNGGAAISNNGGAGTSRPLISNAILYDFTAAADVAGGELGGDAEIYNSGDASPTLDHALVVGGCPTGALCTAVSDLVIGYDGRFIDILNPAGPDGRFATGDDGLRLGLASAARDRGDDALPGDSADLDGDGNTTEALPLDIVGGDRIQGAHVDLGAYEAGAAYTIGGTIAGLAGGNSLTLRNNGGDDLKVTANGSFAFAARVLDGDSYEVTAATQPTGPIQTCTVANGSGTVSGTNVTTVEVTCQTDTHTDTHTIGGEVSGLDAGKSVVLAEADSGQTVTVSADGSFTFPWGVADGSGYTVTVSDQPAGQACAVSDGSGTVSGGDVSDIQVACAVGTHLVMVTFKGDGKVEPHYRTVTHGETAAFTVTPAEGHRATVAGDCPAGRLAGTAYTTGAITDACTVNVTFERIPPTLALTGGNGQAVAVGK